MGGIYYRSVGPHIRQPINPTDGILVKSNELSERRCLPRPVDPRQSINPTDGILVKSNELPERRCIWNIFRKYKFICMIFSAGPCMSVPLALRFVFIAAALEVADHRTIRDDLIVPFHRRSRGLCELLCM